MYMHIGLLSAIQKLTERTEPIRKTSNRKKTEPKIEKSDQNQIHFTFSFTLPNLNLKTKYKPKLPPPPLFAFFSSSPSPLFSSSPPSRQPPLPSHKTKVHVSIFIISYLWCIISQICIYIFIRSVYIYIYIIYVYIYIIKHHVMIKYIYSSNLEYKKYTCYGVIISFLQRLFSSFHYK